MDLMNFGLQQLQGGKLNNMLQQVGVDDVGSFVNQFRNQASHEAERVHDEEEDEDAPSGGNSSLNQMSGGRGDMIQGAMNAYKTFSGGKTSGGGGGFLDNVGSTVQNAQQMYALYKQFDKNGDGKITVEDIEIYLKEMGLGGVSPYVAKGLFQAVDQNHNGTLDFTDLMALTALLNKLYGQYGQRGQ